MVRRSTRWTLPVQAPGPWRPVGSTGVIRGDRHLQQNAGRSAKGPSNAAASKVLRRATPADADTIAAVLTAARAQQAFIPLLHTAEDDRRFVTNRRSPRTRSGWSMKPAKSSASPRSATISSGISTWRRGRRGAGSAPPTRPGERATAGRLHALDAPAERSSTRLLRARGPRGSGVHGWLGERREGSRCSL